MGLGICESSPHTWLFYLLSPPDGSETYLESVNRLIADFPVIDEGVFILKDLQENAKNFEALDHELGTEQQWDKVCVSVYASVFLSVSSHVYVCPSVSALYFASCGLASLCPSVSHQRFLDHLSFF